MFKLCLFLFVLVAIPLNAQHLSPIDFNTFEGIKSHGSIPDDLYKSSIQKYFEQWLAFQKSGQKRSATKNKEEFWQKQFQQIDRMVQSGRFVFGDPISVYLNTIADTLLKDQPELRDEIRIYSFKSPSVNAFCLADGMIGINVGLLAHVQSEAELAFVIAHEISHYTAQHSFERFEQSKQLEKGGWRNRLHPIQKFDKLVSRGREQEFDADQQGVEFFLKSSYHPAAMDEALSTLFESYVPYGRVKVGKDFLETDDFRIPAIYFKKELKPISNQENYFDETHNHPNIFKRRLAVKASMAKADTAGRTRFVQQEWKFYHLRKLARFESLREKLLYGSYGSALYDIYVLQKEYPNNTFLKLAKVHALYSLASFKCIDEISAVVASTSIIEGPSLQVFYILKRLTKEQVVSIALHHTLKLQEEYPGEKVLEDYTFHLTRMMMIDCNLDVDVFKVDDIDTAFNKTKDDFSSERHYLRAKQQFHQNFYKNLFKREYADGWLKENLDQHIAYRDSLKKEDYMLLDDKEERKEELEDLWDEKGIGVMVNQVLLYSNIEELSAEASLKGKPENWKKEVSLDEKMASLFEEVGIKTNLISLKNLKRGDEQNYNQISLLEEWKNENLIFESFDLQSIYNDFTEKLSLNEAYFCRINGWELGDNKFLYQFELFKQGEYKPLYSREARINASSFIRKLEKEVKKDLNRIHNIK